MHSHGRNFEHVARVFTKQRSKTNKNFQLTSILIDNFYSLFSDDVRKWNSGDPGRPARVPNPPSQDKLRVGTHEHGFQFWAKSQTRNSIKYGDYLENNFCFLNS